MHEEKKCLLLFSGGLDSRLAMKIMQEQDFEILAVFFRLPFGEGCCNPNCSFNFSQLQGIKLKVFDCTKGELLQEYLNVIKEAKHGTGSSVNPCIDCRIFMFKRAGKLADKLKINLVVSGEVLEERPMSQMKKSLNIVEKESDLTGRLLRPLSAKLLPPTNAEKNNLIRRDKLFDIRGRSRKKQIELAEKFKIKFPNPAGGCLLCEKALSKRFKFLFNRGLDENEIKLANIGRHFLINNCWIILGRNKEENKIIEKLDEKKYELIIPDYMGPSAIVLDKPEKNAKYLREKIKKLIKAYSKKGSLDEREKFNEYKL